MPYIVTTKRPAPCMLCDDPACGHRSEESTVHAAAALEQANITAYGVAPPTMCDRCESPNAPWQFSRHLGSPFPAGRWCDCDGGQVDPIPVARRGRVDYFDVRALFSLPESGGTIGPLPDGTEVEVEALSWADLRERAGLDRDGLFLDRQTLDAFNARQAA